MMKRGLPPPLLLAATLASALLSGCATGPYGGAYAGTARFAPKGTFLFIEAYEPRRALAKADESLAFLVDALGRGKLLDAASELGTLDPARIASGAAAEFMAGLFPGAGPSSIDPARPAGFFLFTSQGMLRYLLALPAAPGARIPREIDEAQNFAAIEDGYILLGAPISAAPKSPSAWEEGGSPYAMGGGASWFLKNLPPHRPEGLGFSCDVAQMLPALGVDVAAVRGLAGMLGSPSTRSSEALIAAFDETRAISGSVEFLPEGIALALDADFLGSGEMAKYLARYAGTPASRLGTLATLLPPGGAQVYGMVDSPGLREDYYDALETLKLSLGLVLTDGPFAGNIDDLKAKLGAIRDCFPGAMVGSADLRLDPRSVPALQAEPAMAPNRLALTSLLAALPPTNACAQVLASGAPANSRSIMLAECKDPAMASALFRDFFEAVLAGLAPGSSLGESREGEVLVQEIEFVLAGAGGLDGEPVRLAIAYGKDLVAAATGPAARARAVAHARAGMAGGAGGFGASGAGKALLDGISRASVSFLSFDFATALGGRTSAPLAVLYGAEGVACSLDLRMGWNVIPTLADLAKPGLDTLRPPSGPARAEVEEILGRIRGAATRLGEASDGIEAFLTGSPPAAEIEEGLPALVRDYSGALLEFTSVYFGSLGKSILEGSAKDEMAELLAYTEAKMAELASLAHRLDRFLQGEALDLARELLSSVVEFEDGEE